MGLLEKYSSNELLRASFILLVLLNISNLLNYLFHFIMGRMLGPAEYGILAVLTSMLYIFSVPTNAIQTLVSRHTTRFSVKKEYGKIKGMIKTLIGEALILATVLFLIFLILAYIFSDTIGIPFLLLSLTGLYIFGAFLSPIGVGILQGSKKFSVWGWNSILNSTIKIIIAIGLVLAGFHVYGPILGFFFGVMISFVAIFFSIREIVNSKEIKEKIAIITRENIGLIVSILVITLMYSLDIIFAKIFFSADIAGKYAVASMIGKIIFFGTASISGAMFPISSERYYKKEKNTNFNLINRTFFIISILCAIAIIGLWIFPKLVIGMLFGSAYVEVYGIMVYMGVAYSFLSLTNTWILYKISVGEFRIRHAIYLGFLLLIQIAGFIIFRENIALFSIVFMISTMLTFISSILFIRTRKK